MIPGIMHKFIRRTSAAPDRLPEGRKDRRGIHRTGPLFGFFTKI